MQSGYKEGNGFKRALVFVVSSLLVINLILSIGRCNSKISVAVAESAMPLGIYANLSISIGGGDGEVWAEAKNNFTLFPSVIFVYVELYSSMTYQEQYTSMTLEKQVSVDDLDQGQSLRAAVPTGGEEKYWCARLAYKFDDREWVSKTTPVLLFDADGNRIVSER